MTEYNVGALDRIPPGEGREFRAGGRRIAVFRMRVSGGVYATQAACPHKGAPLADGLTGGGVVVCPFHAWKFDLATGLPVFGQCGIAVYEARVTDAGDVLVSVPEPDEQGEAVGENAAAPCAAGAGA